jgi:superfamily I DNA/RNA helicase
MDDTWMIRPEQLDDDQRRIISLPRDGSHLILGPPGSGKTNLVVLRATRLLRSQAPDFVVLVFTRTLEEFIANCPTPYAIPRDRLKTCQRWAMQLVNSLGGSPSSSPDFMQQRVENCVILTGLVEDQGLAAMYDTILLDEAQDYLPEEVTLFRRLANHLFCVADSHQQIYDHSAVMETLESVCGTTHRLTTHYRNGLTICKYADNIGSRWQDYVPFEPTSQYDEVSRPSTVVSSMHASISDQAAAIIDAVRVQLRAYPNELIGILCPRHQELNVIRTSFEESDLDSVTVYQDVNENYVAFRADARICVCTLHAAKGLEFRAAHIAGAEQIRVFRRSQHRVAFTAGTRAKTALAVYHTRPLPSYLDGAITAAAPRVPPPTIEELFE